MAAPKELLDELLQDSKTPEDLPELIGMLERRVPTD